MRALHLLGMLATTLLSLEAPESSAVTLGFYGLGSTTESRRCDLVISAEAGEWPAHPVATFEDSFFPVTQRYALSTPVSLDALRGATRLQLCGVILSRTTAAAGADAARAAPVEGGTR